MRASDELSIGALAARVGVSVSALRFYEEKGLVSPDRNAGGQRRFRRSDARRVSFILIAQQLGFTIQDIRALLATLPDARTPTREDWQQISARFRSVLDDQIASLEQTRDRLDDCIGCGCLSLKACQLYNADDRAAARGAGPRFLLGDTPASLDG